MNTSNTSASAAPPLAVAHPVLAEVVSDVEHFAPSAPPKELVFSGVGGGSVALVTETGTVADREEKSLGKCSKVFLFLLALPLMIVSSPIILIEKARAGQPVCSWCCQGRGSEEAGRSNEK